MSSELSLHQPCSSSCLFSRGIDIFHHILTFCPNSDIFRLRVLCCLSNSYLSWGQPYVERSLCKHFGSRWRAHQLTGRNEKLSWQEIVMCLQTCEPKWTLLIEAQWGGSYGYGIHVYSVLKQKTFENVTRCAQEKTIGNLVKKMMDLTKTTCPTESVEGKVCKEMLRELGYFSVLNHEELPWLVKTPGKHLYLSDMIIFGSTTDSRLISGIMRDLKPLKEFLKARVKQRKLRHDLFALTEPVLQGFGCLACFVGKLPHLEVLLFEAVALSPFAMVKMFEYFGAVDAAWKIEEWRNESFGLDETALTPMLTVNEFEHHVCVMEKMYETYVEFYAYFCSRISYDATRLTARANNFMTEFRKGTVFGNSCSQEETKKIDDLVERFQRVFEMLGRCFL